MQDEVQHGFLRLRAAFQSVCVAVGHRWTEWVVFPDGLEVRACLVCDEVSQRRGVMV